MFQNLSIETGAYAVYKTSKSSNSCKFLVNEIILPNENDYYKRSPVVVAFSPKFTEQSIQKCEKFNGHLLDIHTHPWSDNVQFSSVDDNEAVNTKIPYFRQYVEDTQIAFIVFGCDENIVRARFWDKTLNKLSNIDRIVVI